MTQLRLITLLALFTAFSLAQGDEEAVRSLSQRWAELYNEGEIGALAELYTEDAVLYGNTGGVLEGKEAIRAALGQAHDAAPGDMSRQSTDEVEVFDDTAYDIGSYTVTDAGGRTVSRGYYLALLKKVEGEWRIYRQIDNLDVSLLQDGEEATAGNAAATCLSTAKWVR